MLTRYRFLPTLLAAVVLAISSSACAAQVYGGRYPSPGPRVVDDRAFRFGYDSGIIQGRDDARRGRNYNVERHGEFRSADRGYGGYGSRNEYRLTFRRGFASGYDDGYRRNDRDDRNDRDRRDGPNYGNGRNGAINRSPAADTGYRDGYAAGRDDARDGDRFDPVRDKHYRDGDNDYDNRYGSRDEYKREYRQAFQRGYEQGYREVRR